MKYSITQNGTPLDKKLYTLDEDTKTFSSSEDNLVLDFKGESGCTFKTGSRCTFDTGSRCIFNTGFGCIFNTGSRCTFKTGSRCTFDTASGCTFDTDSDCTFDTGSDCTFDTGYDCTFKTAFGCTFDTGSGCTFDTGSDCVVIRRDVYEVIELKENVKIKLNEHSIKGYTEVEEAPIEMTIKQIEEKLNITGLKIVN